MKYKDIEGSNLSWKGAYVKHLDGEALLTAHTDLLLYPRNALIRGVRVERWLTILTAHMNRLKGINIQSTSKIYEIC